ncbi:MAG: hypothetical protein ABH891_05140 [Candidatus Omnitrophota bacterium]
MKKYIYGTVFVAVCTALVVFFFRPPETTNRSHQTVLAITFRFPENYEFTEGAPFLLTWQAEGPEGKLSIPVPDENFNPLVSPYKLVFAPDPGSAAVVLNARLYYCHTLSRMCFQDDFKARVPLIAGNTSPISYVWEIVPKQAAD